MIAVTGPAAVARSDAPPVTQPPLPPYSDPVAEAQILPQIAQQLADQAGVSLAEATRQIAAQAPYGELYATIAARYPSTFAGLWIDRKSGDYHLAATDVAALQAMVDVATARRLPVIPGLVPHSMKELQATMDRLNAGRDPDVPARVLYVVLEPSTDTVAVEVPAEQVADLRAALDAAGRTDVTVHAGVPRTPVAALPLVASARPLAS
jgi:streptogrisin C